jgi:hypothetical protein
MRQSQIVMASVLAVVALGTALVLGVVRVGMSAALPARSAEAPGPQTTRSFDDLTGFRGVDASGTWQVEIVRSDRWGVEVSFPENFEDRVQVRVLDERLVLNYRGGGRRFGNDRLTARISMPDLDHAEVSGAATLSFSGFSGAQLRVELSGAGQIDGRDGRYERISIGVSGAGRVDLGSVLAVDADVDLSGAGRATLGMNGGVLSGEISGAGRVEYSGSTSQQSVRISGAGSVAQVN